MQWEETGCGRCPRSLRGRSATRSRRLGQLRAWPQLTKPYEPQPQRLLPDARQDWVPEVQLAYFTVDSVYRLDLSASHTR